MDPKILITKIISKLSSREKLLLSLNDQCIIIRSNLNFDYEYYKIVDITQNNIGDWFEECKIIKNINSWVVITRIDQYHNLFQYYDDTNIVQII
jgi:hypothetical protein